MLLTALQALFSLVNSLRLNQINQRLNVMFGFVTQKLFLMHLILLKHFSINLTMLPLTIVFTINIFERC